MGMVAVVPDPFQYTITYSVGIVETEITIEVSASSLTEAILALTEPFAEHGCPIKILTAGGSND